MLLWKQSQFVSASRHLSVVPEPPAYEGRSATKCARTLRWSLTGRSGDLWLNGRQTVDIIVDDAPNSEWFRLLESTESEDHFARLLLKAKTGPILLQDHGARVAFRNIRIRRLNSKIEKHRVRQKSGW